VTNCCWQTVPHDWPGHRESSVAKYRPRTWNRVVGAGRRAEPIACWIIVVVGVMETRPKSKTKKPRPRPVRPVKQQQEYVTEKSLQEQHARLLSKNNLVQKTSKK